MQAYANKFIIKVRQYSYILIFTYLKHFLSFTYLKHFLAN